MSPLERIDWKHPPTWKTDGKTWGQYVAPYRQIFYYCPKHWSGVGYPIAYDDCFGIECVICESSGGAGTTQ